MIWLVIRLLINYKGYFYNSRFIVFRLKNKAGTGPLSPGMKDRVKADQSLCLTVVTTKCRDRSALPGRKTRAKQTSPCVKQGKSIPGVERYRDWSESAGYYFLADSDLSLHL